MDFVIGQHGSRGFNSNSVEKWFILSAGLILLATGAAKIFSITGNQGILDVTDPVFGISFRHLMLIMGFLEITISMICLFTTKRNLSLGLIVWMATGFMMYRIGLWFVGWHGLCPCLGSFYDAIHLSPRLANLLVEAFLVYLLVGSYGLVCPKVLKKLANISKI